MNWRVMPDGRAICLDCGAVHDPRPEAKEHSELQETNHMKKKPTKSARHYMNVGANKAFDTVRAKLKRELAILRRRRNTMLVKEYKRLYRALLAWVNEHDIRNRRKGGLGRK